jgi:hypothetical protein
VLARHARSPPASLKGGSNRFGLWDDNTAVKGTGNCYSWVPHSEKRSLKIVSERVTFASLAPSSHQSAELVKEGCG